MGGDLTAAVSPQGNGLTLFRPDGSAAIAYTGLSAFDSAGHSLPASLEAADRREH